MADLAIEDLTVEYERGGYVVRAVDSLNVEASTGELVLLLGPSGCGKTTLLSAIAGILRPTRGVIRVGGTAVTQLEGKALDKYRRRTVGIVFQSFNLIPSLSALENVETPLRLGGVKNEQARARASELLDRVGLADRMNHKPGSLSGGQQQRVAIARGLAFDPPVILADEPTAHLDYIQVEGVLQLIRSLAQPERLVVVATHDDRMVPLADRVIELAPRFAGLSRPPEEVILEPGETLFEQGSRGDLIYFVDEGTVDIVRIRGDRSEEHVAQVRPGEYFGELGPLLGFPRTATARAHTAVRLTGFTVRDFRERAASDPKVAALLGGAGRATSDRAVSNGAGRNGAKPKRAAKPRAPARTQR